MATKTYKLRIALRGLEKEPPQDSRFANGAEEILQYLWDTHFAFNAGVNYLAGELLCLRRGAGVWRERQETIWGEWTPIRTLEQLQDIRLRKSRDPSSVSLVENDELLNRFRDRGKSDTEAIALAIACSAIFESICPPAAEGEQTQMPRDDLDLLTNPRSTAKELRPRGQTKSGTEKEKSGRRPVWLLDKVIEEECKAAATFDELISRLQKHDEFTHAKRDGAKRLKVLKDKFGNAAGWEASRSKILDQFGTWREKLEKASQKRHAAEDSGAIAAYCALLLAGCLPLPGFATYTDKKNIEFGTLKLVGCGSEWKRAMWNAAGQKVRSHMGWIRRRSAERLLLKKRKALFENGGWVRVRQDGKKLSVKNLCAEHILFSEPPVDAPDFEYRPPFVQRRWFQILQAYEETEMPKRLAGGAFGARTLLLIRPRMIKGWDRIRAKWRKVSSAKPGVAAEELIEEVNALRSRQPRDVGDQELFLWLAEAGHRFLWDGSDRGDDNDCGRDDRDCIRAYPEYNDEFADQPSSITFTENHPVKHPAWMFFGEQSAVKYKLERHNGQVYLIFAQLLTRAPDGVAYMAKNKIRVPLHGYTDFQRSFPRLLRPVMIAAAAAMLIDGHSHSRLCTALGS
jgi:hypothetical protein